MIYIRNLTKHFQTSGGVVKALDHVSFTIEDGEIFGVIGMSGAGKSTLLRCVGLLEELTDGEIIIDDQNISKASGKNRLQLHRQISIVFQGFNLLMQRTVRQNIALPLEFSGMKKKEIQPKVDEMIKLVGLEGKEDVYPSQLSGGQKQRVAIARALVTNPKLLLCDEPTSALDSLTTSSILELLRKVNQEYGVTILIITHEIGVVRSLCNKVGVIDHGNIVELGETKEVFEHPQATITKLLLGKEDE